MKKIVVASRNQVKIQAALTAFETMFPDESFEATGVSVPSGVSEQPMTDDETLTGAVNRVQKVKDATPDADFWVGIEGGVAARNDIIDCFGWMVIRSENFQSEARSCSFPLPPAIVNELRTGKELGPVMDAFFGTHNSKQSCGAAGLLTHNKVTRPDLYLQPLMLALIPFVNPGLW